MAEPALTADRQQPRYLVLDPSLSRGALISDGALGSFSERHKIEIRTPDLQPLSQPLTEAARLDARGIVCCVDQGWVGRGHLRLAKRALRAGSQVFFYWPAEGAIEVVDRDGYRSHRNVWLAAKAYFSLVRPLANRTRAAWASLHHLLRRARMVLSQPRRTARALRQTARAAFLAAPAQESGLPAPQAAVPVAATDAAAKAALTEVLELLEQAAPVAMQPQPEPGPRVEGTGVYLRTDYWARISSGGSYGHTCYVAKELAAACRDFVCFMPHRYSLLDDLGVHQVVLPSPSESSDEETIAGATRHYRALLRPALQALRPRLVYERLCLGNYAGAALSRELQIPYIVEYNGSEISMRRSFGSSSYKYEELYLEAEEAAFAQATMISVVSEPIKEDLVRRGVDADKILVNPNGADCRDYAPADASEKARLRQELGFKTRDKVIGFTGTFGGWHGIDVLAASLPRICQQDPDARFLLIGDGSYKHLVDKQIVKHELRDRVVSTGRIGQAEGARLMRASDIFVSPHNRHMVDSRFFGSPTKVFEYMAVGAGIVASDLEQIGEVLSPALGAADLAGAEPRVTNERAVLCVPGDVDDFVNGVVGLLRHRGTRKHLGRNARQAILDHYSWQRHVDKVLMFLAGERDFAGARSLHASRRPPWQAGISGDEYKAQAQAQWDNDPCGSHYVEESEQHTLAWYQEAEQYRFGSYAPWMPEVMEFGEHPGERVLEIGAGMGTDLSQFARNGSRVVDVDLSRGHLVHARENFSLRGLSAGYVHADAELLPFADGTFDVVYSNGVIHHTPGTRHVVTEIERVLKRQGKAIVMVYAENSLHYWAQIIYRLGLVQGLLRELSVGEIMSRHVERSEAGARPLVKVYTRSRLRKLFEEFDKVAIVRRQLTSAELPKWLRWLPLGLLGKLVGWNLILKASKS